MKTFEKLLKLPRFEQHLYVNRLNKVRAIALAMDLKVNTANLSLPTLQVAIEKELNQFPEVRDEVLAIDRGIDYFVKQDEDDGLKFFLKEVARDINEGWLSEIRYNELLPINIFNKKEFDTKEGILSGTLIAFILPQLDKPKYFLEILEEYNSALFKNYIKTVNQYVNSSETADYSDPNYNLETKPLFELYDAHWKELGLKEKDWLEIRNIIAPKNATIPNARNEEVRVDTHNTASHKSADESHVKAFGIFAKSVNPTIQLEFKNEYEKEFDSKFCGYETDSVIANIKRNALNNIEIPVDLKKFGLNYDALSTQEICDSIVNGTLPFLRFDKVKDYQTRLTHYINRAQFVRNLVGYFNALDKNIDANQQAFLFLANSKLPEDVTKHIVIKTIDNVQFTLNDIKGLGKEEFAALIRYNNKKGLLDWCANNLYDTFNLPNLVVSKLVTNLADELKVPYGHNESTILHIASEVGDTALITKILNLPEGKAALSLKDNHGSTPLHWAALYGHTAAIAKMLKHPEGKVALSIKNKYDYTPLHYSAGKGHTALLTEMLKHEEGKAALSIKNNLGETPLHLAAWNGNTALLAEMLKHTGIISLLFIRNNTRRTMYELLCGTAYELLNTEQKLKLAQKIGVGFEAELSDQDKNRLLQSISTHLSVHGLNYTSTSHLANQAEQNHAEIVYNTEYDRLLRKVIDDLTPKNETKRNA